MNRVPEDITRQEYDVLVIGGGIYGACVARDAALRGLKVVLLEKGDFGHATSGNSHKIIHGGLRYLQHGDLIRMRQSIYERRALVRMAPHLVKPMPFLIPTYQNIGAKKSLLRIALMANDFIAFDRNRDLPESLQFPASRVLSNEKCLEHCGMINQHELTGGAYYFDAQVHNSERLLLSMLLSAHDHGADVLNYVRVSTLLVTHGSAVGVEAEDVLAHNSLEIRAKFVVNCSGPWLDQMWPMKTRQGFPRTQLPLLKAIVLVTNPIVDTIALGVPSRYTYVDVDAVVNKGCRYFFMTPWKNRCLVGTFQTRYEGSPDDACVTEEEIESQLKEINASLPEAVIARNDVHLVNWGLLPRAVTSGVNNDVQLAKHPVIHDHEKIDGVRGILSVSGVKFTTARGVAEKTIDLVFRKLGKKSVPCTTATVPVYGGNFLSHEELLRDAISQKPKRMSQEVVQHVVDTYGSNFRDIFQYSEEDLALGDQVEPHMIVTKAEIIHGVRREMAQTLSDIVFRRTELGAMGHPGDECLRRCAMLMAREMNWNEARIQHELHETNAEYRRKGVSECTSQRSSVSL